MIKHLILVFLLFGATCFGQVESTEEILTNEPLVVELLADFANEAESHGVNVNESLFQNVKYVLIAVPNKEVNNLGRYLDKEKAIVLSHDTMLDKMILKMILYRELLHSLGIPYDSGSRIMNLEQDKGFSYSVFYEDIIMDTEFSSAVALLEEKPKAN